MSTDEKLTYFRLFIWRKKNESLRQCQLTKSLLIWRLFILTRKIWSLRICQLDEKLTYFIYLYKKKCRWTRWRKYQLTKIDLFYIYLFCLTRKRWSLRVCQPYEVLNYLCYFYVTFYLFCFEFDEKTEFTSICMQTRRKVNLLYQNIQ